MRATICTKTMEIIPPNSSADIHGDDHDSMRFPLYAGILERCVQSIGGNQKSFRNTATPFYSTDNRDATENRLIPTKVICMYTRFHCIVSTEMSSRRIIPCTQMKTDTKTALSLRCKCSIKLCCRVETNERK